MIVWAVALGWMVFGDVPDAFTLTGAAIIVRGLYILWREQIVTAQLRAGGGAGVMRVALMAAAR